MTRSLLLAATLVLVGCDHHVVANLSLSATSEPIEVEMELCNALCAKDCTSCGECLPDRQRFTTGTAPTTIALRSELDRQFTVRLSAVAEALACAPRLEIDVGEGEPLPFDINATLGCNPTALTVAPLDVKSSTVVRAIQDCDTQ
ncbi:MAG: hypothetical protein KC503_22940 [Myxococcales bacterium]|nr:hypothetical protein [Myxococcales bacterium]